MRKLTIELEPPEKNRLMFWGVACGLLSAIGYTAANICLRYLSDFDSFFVSTIRAVPTFFVVLPMLAWRTRRGETVVRGMHRIPYLIAAGVCGQLFGNVCFQASLHIVGIAVAVPLVLGSMIVSGAFIGWFVLGERVTRRTMVGIVLLIVALGIISMGAGAVQEKVGAESSGLHQVSTAILLLALAGNIAGGISYSIMGTVMRRSFQQGMLPEMAMLVLSIVGFVLLGFISTFRIDLQSIQLIRSLDWIAMGFAGVFNALAFFALSIALKNLNLISVHMLNATQATLALLAGFLIFNEPMTIYLPVGLAFTVVGLLVAGYRKGRDSGMKTGTTTDAKTGPETGTETTALPHVSLANNTANSSVLTAEPDVLEARSEIGHS